MKNPFKGAIGKAKRAASQVVVLVPEKVRHEASVSSSQAHAPFQGHSGVASAPSGSQEAGVSEQGRSAAVTASAPTSDSAGDKCMVCGDPLEIPEGVIAVRICKRCIDGGFRVAGAVGRIAGWLEKFSK